jgi:hypothetical protein
VNVYRYVGNGVIISTDPTGLDAVIIVTRPAGNKSGASTVTVTENGKLVGTFTGNRNGYINNGRGGPLPNGDYVLRPKPESQIYPKGDSRRETEYPVNTPSITRPENADPSKSNYEPGRVADDVSNIRVHGSSSDGSEDSNGCLTCPDGWDAKIQEIMMRNLENGGTKILYRCGRK